MLSILALNEKMQTEITSMVVVVAKPIPQRVIEYRINPKVMGTRLSNRETNQPENGNPIKELIGMQSRMVPNSASLYPKFILRVGILEAQVEKQKPERRKNILK